MTDGAKRQVTSASRKQSSPFGLGLLEQIQSRQKTSSCLRFKQCNSVVTSLLGKKSVFNQGHCTRVLYHCPAPYLSLYAGQGLQTFSLEFSRSSSQSECILLSLSVAKSTGGLGLPWWHLILIVSLVKCWKLRIPLPSTLSSSSSHESPILTRLLVTSVWCNQKICTRMCTHKYICLWNWSHLSPLLSWSFIRKMDQPFFKNTHTYFPFSKISAKCSKTFCFWTFE